MTRVLFVPVLIAMLSACGSSDDGAGTVPSVTTADEPPATRSTSTPPTTERSEPVVAPSSPPAPGSSAPGPPRSLPSGDNDVERAIADVVARTGADAAAVTVITDQEVTWRDSAVGCPQKGMSYLQVLTDGRRVVLELDGRRFDYHSGGGRDLFYCARPQPPVGE